MPENRRLDTIALNDLPRVHGAVVATARSSDEIRQPWIRVDKRSLDLERGPFVHSMAVDDVGNIEPGPPYFPDAPQLVVWIISPYLLANVREHPIALALTDLEGLPVSRVYEPIDVRLELFSDARRERIRLLVHLVPRYRGNRLTRFRPNYSAIQCIENVPAGRLFLDRHPLVTRAGIGHSLDDAHVTHAIFKTRMGANPAFRFHRGEEIFLHPPFALQLRR